MSINKNKRTPNTTPEQIHEELKKLHVSVQVLMAAVTKLHEEVRQFHVQEPSPKPEPKKGFFSWWS